MMSIAPSGRGAARVGIGTARAKPPDAAAGPRAPPALETDAPAPGELATAEARSPGSGRGPGDGGRLGGSRMRMTRGRPSSVDAEPAAGALPACGRRATGATPAGRLSATDVLRGAAVRPAGGSAIRIAAGRPASAATQPPAARDDPAEDAGAGDSARASGTGTNWAVAGAVR
jgi:hypothetical protein